MGKSNNGKELGKGISQRKDGLYQGRFVTRFGKKRTVYGSTLKEVRQKLRQEQNEDEMAINVVSRDMTLDEWHEIWKNICKKNCRSSTLEAYETHYKRMQKALGWRKLTSLNLIVVQDVFNQMRSDNARKNSKKILSEMLEQAIDSDLLIKNVAKQINTVVSKEDKNERKVLTRTEAKRFF